MDSGVMRLATAVAAFSAADAAWACPACSMNPEVPGMLPYLPQYALPTALLTAAILRPFFRKAGVPTVVATRAAVRASVAGLLAGFLTLFVTMPMWFAGPVAILLVPAAAYWAIVAIAGRYASPLKWGWVLSGYLLANVVQWTVVMAVFGYRSRFVWLVRLARQHEPQMLRVGLVASLVLLMTAAMWPPAGSAAAESDRLGDTSPARSEGPPL